MKGKKGGEFFVKQTGPNEKEVVLTTKYTIKSDHHLFEPIEYLVQMIDEKNVLVRKHYHDVFEISYFHTVEFTLAGSKMEDEKCMICLEEFVIKPPDREC
jgi:hypothetical protein